MKKQVIGGLASFSLIALVIVGSLGVMSVETGCKSECSTSEAQACDGTYNTCIQTAATNADQAACQKCVDSYCSCYDDCGNSCDKDKLKSSCTGSGP